jgi:hypothetical protein
VSILRHEIYIVGLIVFQWEKSFFGEGGHSLYPVQKGLDYLENPTITLSAERSL